MNSQCLLCLVLVVAVPRFRLSGEFIRKHTHTHVGVGDFVTALLRRPGMRMQLDAHTIYECSWMLAFCRVALLT
jgi:hypothetical protein